MKAIRNAIPAARPVSSKTGAAGPAAAAPADGGAADGAVPSPQPAQSTATAAPRTSERVVGTSPLLRRRERRLVAHQELPAELLRVPLRGLPRRERMDVAPRGPDRHHAALDEPGRRGVDLAPRVLAGDDDPPRPGRLAREPRHRAADGAKRARGAVRFLDAHRVERVDGRAVHRAAALAAAAQR